MAATPHVKIVKSFTYRGAAHLFSNAYHFSGGTPADDTAWETLLDAVTADEKPIYRDDVSIVQGVGYEAGSDVPVFTKTYSLAGTGSFTSPVDTPGDCAALLRYATAARSSKNHPVYLYNYFHGALGTYGSAADSLASDQKTAIEEYGDDWLAGFSDGTHTCVRAGPNGATAVSRFVHPYITHRDFSN